MLRSDGTPFNRESEREKWDYVDEVETELLRARSVHDTVREFLQLYAQPLQEPIDDQEREAWLLEMQRRTRALNG